MLDKKFYKLRGPYNIKEIANVISVSFDENIDQTLVIKSVKSLEEAENHDISFLNNKKYTNSFKATKAGACVVSEDFVAPDSDHKIILLRSKNPYFVYKKLIDLFYIPRKTYKSKIMNSAYISPSAKIGVGVYIGHNVVIEDEVIIGDNSIIESSCVINHGVVIGNRARIESNVSISHSIIGDDVVILSGARIGNDGFGFATYEGKHHKIYHIGRVLIGNDVEIGANTTIDRGSMNDTIIEDFCRIDNLVQIGHNVKIGTGSIIVAQVGIAGSSKIGKYCALGGQVGVAGHINIADKVQIAAQSGVVSDITDENITVAGSPSVPLRDWLKQVITMKKIIKKEKI